MYASKTPRDLNHDPLPWVNGHGTRSRDDGVPPRPSNDMAGWNCSKCIRRRDPRPEFDHIQHNDPNPLLTILRSDMETQAPVLSRSRVVELWLDNDIAGRLAETPAQLDHARRVLERLAALRETS